ncbi:tRNA/rRNA cytosine-C5-methylase [Thermobacillus composti KWC4]|uniref:tRNA/rRNA cytosine-C5-methylase n=1 Tax=Thermobacillus composti (strain DSM 18247 / JCM 13945 / KWC4) TaxID=717605 RepID=L0ECT1_THECK|nr:RsmB/NOP family class I SAM-dependent RNA methyltransferase [Thermobacillus composti]AGA57607.1 tRNA/rRNA cytosine-C5-methylase [Thermobacillus composti KWC4]
MTVRLPELFVARMRTLLGDEFDDWLASYAAPRRYGLRVNTLKTDGESYRMRSPLSAGLKPVPWAEAGYYYSEEDRPGKHPHYHAGLYYIQEPSAMAPAELLNVQPGHRVLDLCAAPGGKSSQIAAKLKGHGLLVANDNARERTKALARNLELAGVRNAVVLNEEPERLVPVFRAFFDRILVDAPCSGEGMFRKDESMIADWLRHPAAHWTSMQREILRHAAEMLAPGGVLVYSTCTFSPEENEERIAELLAERPDFEVVPVPPAHGWAPGRPDWVSLEGIEHRHVEAVAGTVRLWPHRIEGEGHYAAVLRRQGGDSPGLNVGVAPQDPAETSGSGKPDRPRLKTRPNAGRRGNGGKAGKRGHAMSGQEADPTEVWRSFRAEVLPGLGDLPGRLIAVGEKLYAQPAGVPDLSGLRVVRHGWLLGEARRGRFAPSQALAMGLAAEDAARRVEYGADEPEALKYLKGETLPLEPERLNLRPVEDGRQPDEAGYALVCIDGYPVGWGKLRDGLLINERAPGWRWM